MLLIVTEEWTKKINTMEQRMTKLEGPDRRRSDTKANDIEGKNSQADQNQRRAVVTGFHVDTTTQEVQDTLTEIITTIGMSMEQIQINMHSCNSKTTMKETTLSDQETHGRKS